MRRRHAVEKERRKHQEDALIIGLGKSEGLEKKEPRCLPSVYKVNRKEKGGKEAPGFKEIIKTGGKGS